MRSQVLWIDDGAVADLVELTGPVYSSGKYTLEIAITVAAAIRELQRRQFDAIIVDIRLPPGDLPEWIRLYQSRGQSRSIAQLGLDFLSSCLEDRPTVPLHQRPGWLRPSIFGVFTVEEESVLEARLRELGIRVYRQKTVDPPRRTLIDLIEAIQDHG